MEELVTLLGLNNSHDVKYYKVVYQKGGQIQARVACSAATNFEFSHSLVLNLVNKSTHFIGLRRVFPV
jgi:hypothetical protein